MFQTLQPFSKIAGVALALAFASASGTAADQVRASFDRLLAHEAAPAGAPAATNGPADPLIAALVVPLRDGAWPTPATRPIDPVAESFARMFAHEPSWTTPALPEGAGTDPLIAAVTWPLLRGNQYTVAGVAPAARP